MATGRSHERGRGHLELHSMLHKKLIATEPSRTQDFNFIDVMEHFKNDI